MVDDTWEDYVPTTSRPTSSEALAIIGKRPSIRLTPSVVEAMGKPTHIVLLFDRVGGRVGMRPSSPKVRHAFPLSRYGNMNMATVSAGGFLQWAEVDYSQRREYEVELSRAPEISFRVGRAGAAPGKFEEFLHKNVAVSSLTPNVSVSRNGNITLNQAAMDLLGHPSRVVLRYNRANGLIGFRPATDERNASAVRKSSGQKTWTVAGEGFLKQYGVPHEQGRSFEPRHEYGMLIVDVQHPKPPRRKPRASPASGSE